MKLDFCVLCGTTENLHHHHVIPKAQGGTDNEDNFITLCYDHHAMIHSISPSKFNQMQVLAAIGRKTADFLKLNDVVPDFVPPKFVANP